MTENLERAGAAAKTRATIYLDPALHRALRLKAAETRLSISELVSDAVRQSLSEDQQDLATFDERATEPTISYEELLNKLKASGDL
ncbi:MAG: CopG family transcriptional regulator [Pseudomonadota bacterium]|nr:CopG family transcriptional regulator [Pseudomonadota bacterium]